MVGDFEKENNIIAVFMEVLFESDNIEKFPSGSYYKNGDIKVDTTHLLFCYDFSYDWFLPALFKFRDLTTIKGNPMHTQKVQQMFHKLCYEEHTVQELFLDLAENIKWYNEIKDL